MAGARAASTPAARSCARKSTRGYVLRRGLAASTYVLRSCCCVAPAATCGRGGLREAVTVGLWMVIMAGMLPGVECARRRRLWQGAAEAAAGGTRRSSFCLYAAGHGGHPAGLGAAASSGKQRSGVTEMIHEWTLDSNAREAKERLDQKLRSKREAVIKRHHSTGSIELSRAHGSGGGGGGEGSSTSAAAVLGVQREVYSKKGVMRRLMRWSRPRWDAAEQAECAVCLDEFQAGDVLAHLPCGHRFHWACALPWLEATSRCPFCRAAVDNHPHAAA